MSGLLFLTSKLKGLVPASYDLLPSVEHRFCVMHLHANFKTAGYRSKAYKDLLWNAATSSNVPYFKFTMGKMKETYETVFKWFNDKPTAPLVKILF